MSIDRLKELYDLAIHMEPTARQKFLDTQCAEDLDLRRELDSLLELRPETAFLSASIMGAWDQHLSAPPAGTVGPYRLIGRLGSGGMGTVWLATREAGNAQVKVALKLIKRGLDTDAVVKRFLRERRILADIEHPGVARLIDGGTSEDGLPYLAMEYVRGVQFDTYVTDLAFEARLQLFAAICDAVQAAHALGIVHRDLKPSNILVTPEGAPKLLDFGIAKLYADENEDLSVLTRSGDRPLTPRYAAPEQMRGAAVSSATDVYALGVLLYEMVTGLSPYGTTTTLRDLESAICTGDIRRPSRAKGTTLKRKLRGDIDTMILRCLALEPHRRYSSAGELAQELRRYLADQPIHARRDTALYRTTKFVRRHRVLVTAAAMVFLSLTAGLLFALKESSAARKAQHYAELQTYVASISSAESAVREGKLAQARAQLLRAPEEYRGFEWKHLLTRCDRSAKRGVLPPQIAAFSFDASRHFLLAAGVGEAWKLDAETLAVVARYRYPVQSTMIQCVLQRDGTALLLTAGSAPSEIYRLTSVAEALPAFSSPEVVLRSDLRITAAAELDAERVIVGFADGDIAAYASNDFRELMRVHAHESEVTSFDVHAEQGLLATGSWDCTAAIWDLRDLRPMHRLRGHDSAVRACAFDPLGQRLATAGFDCMVRVWSLEDGQYISTCQAHTSMLQAIDFSRDGKRVISGSRGMLILSDPVTGRVHSRLPGHQDRLRFIFAHPNGAISSADSELLQFAPGAQELWTRMGCEYTRALYLREENQLLAIGPDARPRLWAHESAGSHMLEAPSAPQDMLGAALSGDRNILVGVHERTARLSVWDLARGQLLQPITIEQHLRSIAFAGDELWLLFRDGLLQKWHPQQRTHLAEYKLPAGGYSCIAIEPGEQTALILGTRTLRIDLSTGNFQAAPTALDGSTRCCFTSDGTLGAFVNLGAISIVDLSTWEMKARLTMASSSEDCRALAFSPDGTRFVCGQIDGALSFWDTETWTEVASFSAHGEKINAIAFSPDGASLASVSDEGTIHWWDTAGQ